MYDVRLTEANDDPISGVLVANLRRLLLPSVLMFTWVWTEQEPKQSFAVPGQARSVKQ